MPSWRDLKRFCERDGWTQIKKAADHFYYAKQLDDGTILRTKISHGTAEIHHHLWQQILKKQLKVTQDYFNSKI